jgi:hypothetical protein
MECTEQHNASVFVVLTVHLRAGYRLQLIQRPMINDYTKVILAYVRFQGRMVEWENRSEG